MNNTGQKGHLLNFINKRLVTEARINPDRIYEPHRGANDGGGIVYLTTRELRIEDNFALNYAKSKSKNFKVIHLKKHFENEGKQNFYLENLEILKENYKLSDIDFEILDSDLKTYVKSLTNEALIIDFDPINNDFIFNNFKGIITEIDGHNIIPARIVSDKQEYSAFTFRKKVYYKIYEYLTEFPHTIFKKNKAYETLSNFIDNKLGNYAKEKNNPLIDATSNLSKYMNFGFISPQRVAIEIIKSDAADENKEVYLEELIVRQELSDNFCLYNKNYKSIKAAPDWAEMTLKAHEEDMRPNIFTRDELENVATYDDLWNATQRQLMREGKIHGYLRMFWAKKLLEWTKTPQDAIDYAVYLNDKYAYDGESPNGYVGILWSIAGLHDRAFKNMPVTGEIRRLTGIKTKYERDKYIQKYS